MKKKKETMKEEMKESHSFGPSKKVAKKLVQIDSKKKPAFLMKKR